MDSDGRISVVSITSHISSIQSRTLALADEVGDAITTLDRKNDLTLGLNTTLTSLQHLQQETAALQVALKSSFFISQSIMSSLNDTTVSCNETIAPFSKLLPSMGLKLGPLALVEGIFLDSYSNALQAYSRIFVFFSNVLSKRDRATQDAEMQSLEAHELLEYSKTCSQEVSNSRELLLDARQSIVNGSASDNKAEPPPYEDPEVLAPRELAEQISAINHDESSHSGRGFSFSHSLTAMTSILRSKPDPLSTAFCQAAQRADIQQMKGLISQGANINGRDNAGNSPLRSAILSNQKDAIKFILDSGADTESRDWAKLPPLFLAASVGSIECCRVFLKPGVDVNKRSWTGQPYFIDVISSNNLQGVQFLLEHGADPNVKSLSGRPAIARAVRKGNIELTRLLLSRGANPNTLDISANSLLALASTQNNVELARILLDHGANPNGLTVTGLSLLADALNNHYMELAYLLIERLANPNARDLYGNPLLVTVVKDENLPRSDKVEAARRLLRRGAVPQVTDAVWGVSAICYALQADITELVALMLQHGASTSGNMYTGESQLLYAIDKGRIEQVRLLLSHGANPNAADAKGRTPLLQAMLSHDKELIELLRLRGGDLRQNGLISPVELATAINDGEFLKLLGLPVPSSLNTQQLQEHDLEAGEASRASAGARVGTPPPEYEKPGV